MIYLEDTLYALYKRKKRSVLFRVSKRLAQESGKNRLGIMLDMIHASLKHGAMFTEYEDLNFFYRTEKNRATFITTLYNIRLYNHINKKERRDDFHHKIRFLNLFQPLVHREWIDIKTATEEEVQAFLQCHRKVVVKADYGDSGQEVELWTIPEGYSANQFKEEMEKKQFQLAEECLYNHPVIAQLNESSLNTLRVVTVRRGDQVHFLFAGIRVGQKDSPLDNISQGGAVARIDLETGKINSSFYNKASSYVDIQEKQYLEHIGLQIPYWQEVKEMAIQAAQTIPEINYVAWDICVTENGPAMIEGNESFGSVIMQLYYTPEEEGLKPKLLEILKDGGTL